MDKNANLTNLDSVDLERSVKGSTLMKRPKMWRMQEHKDLQEETPIILQTICQCRFQKHFANKGSHKKRLLFRHCPKGGGGSYGIQKF